MALNEHIDRQGFVPPRRMAVPGGTVSVGRLPLPVLVYFAAILVPVHFYAGPLYMTSVRLVLLLLVVPLFFNLLRGKYGRIIATDYLFVAFIAWMGVSLSVNNPNMMVSQLGSMGAEFLGGYLLGRAFIRSERELSAVIKVLFIMVVLTLPFAVYETLTGRPIIIDIIRGLPGLTSEPVVSIEKRMGLERVQVIFAHPIHYGLFASSAFSLVFVGLRDTYGFGKRILAAAIIGACVIFSLSSGALLAMILQLFLVMWAWVFGKVRSRWIILLGLMALMYVVIDLLSNRTPIRVFMSYATFSPHNAYWRGLIFEWGMKNVWANPLYGLGFNDWVRPWYMYSGSMDNFWLVMAVRYGIPGFLFVAAGYLLLLWKVGRRKLEEHSVVWNLRRAWMIMFIGLTFTLTTVHVWGTMYSFVFFLLGSGVWFTTATSAEPSQETGAGSGPRGRIRAHPAGKPAAPAVPVDEGENTGTSRYSRFPVKPAG